MLTVCAMEITQELCKLACSDFIGGIEALHLVHDVIVARADRFNTEQSPSHVNFKSKASMS